MGDDADAKRYYNDAIYGVWDGNAQRAYSTAGRTRSSNSSAT